MLTVFLTLLGEEGGNDCCGRLSENGTKHERGGDRKSCEPHHGPDHQGRKRNLPGTQSENLVSQRMQLRKGEIKAYGEQQENNTELSERFQFRH